MWYAALRLFVKRSLCFVAVLSAGCGDATGVGRTVPVTGKVTLGGEDFTAKTAAILFKPDRDRGNLSNFEPAGTTDEQGNYKLQTAGKTGAPPGWYRVIVSAYEQPPEHPKTPTREKRPVVRALVDARYGQEQTTPLSIEVTDNPAAGAYDLHLNR